MYQLLKQEGNARRGVFHTVHGDVQMPAFMNVGTAAAIKGGISSYDLVDLKCQVELCNTYHLHIRPGDRLIHDLGGLHRFMGLERANPHGQRRISGVFPGKTSYDSGRGRILCFSCRWKTDFYGPGGKYADSIESGFYDCNGL